MFLIHLFYKKLEFNMKEYIKKLNLENIIFNIV